MLVDAHCHLSYHCSATDEQLRSSHLRCVMSTNHNDWQALKKIKVDGVKKSFGIHPWYSHLFTLEHVDKRSHYEQVLEWKDQDDFNAIVEVLPDPMHLDTYIAKEYDSQSVTVIGEIGLDKLFRLPKNTGFYIEGGGPLSRIRVKMSHQVAVFTRFCQLARQCGKPVSVHGVKCHGLLYDVCRQELMPHDVKICLHSVTASLDTLQIWIKEYGRSTFFSLSKWINFKDSDEGKNLVKMLPLKCILTETDFPIDKCHNSELADQLDCICDQIDSALDNTVDVRQLVYTNFCRFIE
ncbi:hypothetical protein ZYGR_0AD03240 [Zygosaccharomyces rouxii]|uniref:ZYRO0G13530p n=2 Tax=Zygosaccharomyces rouxii TaxID=4956 RepID=C5E0K6_ZYGRC|nr:uncharacterized protein ZYRO0G13530g [Zygosaccharomyces rouxii]KAH9202634.1 TatD family [Zygosaccharomyces rouxii]GAV51141.1 hypothetical protein ZYGR_0AD03240 [Zygosaccharomyces rouxii]CAR29640.1 ZYRO0G13530p [Zygosaccharomyces rouxii]